MLWTAELEKTLENPLECKDIKRVHPKGDQSWVFLEGLMLKLKLQYFGHVMQRVDWLEKTLMLGKIEGRRRRGWQRMGWLEGITDSVDMLLLLLVTSVVSDSVQPHRWQPTRLPCSWDSPGKNTGVGCHFLLQYMKVKCESEVTQSCTTPRDPLPGSSIHEFV